jgi:hypothetical protein
MAITNINILQSKALDFFQIGIFGLKTNHLATLLSSLCFTSTIPSRNESNDRGPARTRQCLRPFADLRIWGHFSEN